VYEEALEPVPSRPQPSFEPVEFSSPLARELQLLLHVFERLGCELSLCLGVPGVLELLAHTAEGLLGPAHVGQSCRRSGH
jgi:hypothetical protein